TSDMSEQHAIFGTGAYRISSREMWQNIKLNEASVESSMKTFNNNKPRTRIQLTDEVLSEFEKIRRGDQEK
ncbi:NYN domain-containing protein, partial [Klebsiella pneumoniae]|nr:NYN domain-containing protein [Klebsiella pneumoniae]